MASDLRDEIARAIYDSMPVTLKDLASRAKAEAATGLSHGPGVPDLWIADAVLRVVGERLLSDEAVEAVAMTYEPDSFVGDAPHADEALRDARDVLSAAWRVVTGSNHE